MQPTCSKLRPLILLMLALLSLIHFSGCTTMSGAAAPRVPSDPWQAALVNAEDVISAPPGYSGHGGGGVGWIPPPIPAPRLPVADVWLTSNPVELGFGQYTYLLLAPEAGPDAPTIRSRNLLLLSTVLQKESASTTLPRLGLSGRDANHLLVPVKSPVADRSPEAVYAEYDFSFASIIYGKLNLSETRGPVLYSSNLPLAAGQALPPLFIRQDLSACPDEIMHVWWRLFLVSSNSPYFWEWDDVTGERLMARFLTGLETAAPALNITTDAMKQFIALMVGNGN